VLFLVGNKVDLGTTRRVPKEDAATFAKENGLLFEESSALFDINITDAFERLLEEIYDRKSRMQSSTMQSERTLGNGGNNGEFDEA
jgi:GTPase SAR1 family protein